MSDDFWTSEGYRPTWRKNSYFKEQRTLRKWSVAVRWMLGGFAVLLILAMCLPPKSGDYREAISYGVSRGEPIPALILASTGFIFISILPALILAKRWLSTALAALSVIGLLLIAATNPFSQLHNLVFFVLCGTVTLWLWLLGAELDDVKILWAARGAFVSALSAVFSLGISERLTILASLFGFTVLVQDHILD